jgi:hypothetical protein
MCPPDFWRLQPRRRPACCCCFWVAPLATELDERRRGIYADAFRAY